MEYKNIQIIPENCPECLDDCTICPYYGGVEDNMVRCFQDEEK